METDRASSATTEGPPFGLPQSTGTGSGRHERHLVRTAHRLPVERPGRHRHLHLQFGISALPGMDRRRGVRCLLAPGANPIRWAQRHRLVVAVDGWSDDEGAIGGFKKTGANPTDRGKQGVKRSLLTEAAGIPIAVAIDGANRHDMKLVRGTLDGIMATRPLPTAAMPQGICLDKGYDFDEVREIVREFGFTVHIRARGEEAKAIQQDGRLQGASLGGGACSQLDESLSSDTRSLGKTSRNLHRHAAPRLRHHHLACNRPTDIGSKMLSQRPQASPAVTRNDRKGSSAR